MTTTIFSKPTTNLQAPTQQQINEKAQILNDLCQFHLNNYQNIEKFIDLIETPLKSYVKARKELYNDYLNVWYLFSQFEDFFKAMRRITRELQENTRGQNITGPFTSWTGTVSSIVSEYLLFFHNYYVYYPTFKYIREIFPEFNTFLLECEGKYEQSISNFFVSYLDLIEVLSNFYKKFCTCVIPQSHDFKQVQELLDITQNALQKSSASLNDGISNKLLSTLSEVSTFKSSCFSPSIVFIYSNLFPLK